MASKPPPSLGAPAGVPPSNAKYVLVAVIIIGAIGAAIAFKLCQKPPPPPPPPVFDAGPVTKPTGRNPDEDVPLPPVIEDAGPDVKTKITYVPGTASQCDAKKCGGASTGELETMLQFRVKQAHRCYDNALAQDPTLRGKVSIAVRVGANGSVCSAAVASNDMGSPQVANCVTGYFRGANFPPPKGGCADINIPINFVPRQ